MGRNAQIVHSELAVNANALNDLFRAPNVAAIWNLGTEAGRLALNNEVTRQATIIAYANDFKLMMWVALLSMPMVLLLRRNRAVTAGPPVAALE